MTCEQKKRVALEVISGNKTITDIANKHQTSRKFIRQQGDKAQAAIDNVFQIDQSDNDDVIYYLPVTKKWIAQLVLALMFLGHTSYRNIITILKDLFDYKISLGSINSIFSNAVQSARKINDSENLANLSVTANDELFHQNKPILSGVDTRSLYCYLLTLEDKRDEETWAIRLLDAEAKGLNPKRTIGDDAKGLVSGHKMVFPEADYHYDNFHLSKALMDLRRYYRNRLKSTISALNDIDSKLKGLMTDKESNDDYLYFKCQLEQIQHLSTTLDTLISWLEHDILNKAGAAPKERRELYDFVVEEFKKLEQIEHHRVKSVRITLENKRDMALGFADVLEEKFVSLSQQFSLPIETLWTLCKLQRCHHGGDQYFFRSLPLQSELGDRFDEIEDAVLQAMDSTERTSSMVENLNGRVKKHIKNRKEIDNGYLNFLRFFINHKPLIRSARAERLGKTPAEILSGKAHPHWLELLGFERFRRAA